MENVEIFEINFDDCEALAPLVEGFRVELKSYKGIAAQPDLEAGAEELREYLEAGWPCYAARFGGEFVGYLVCRVDEPCVWVESIYVAPQHRRHGIATQLFERAEAVARRHGEPTAYNYVHPNNRAMIEFLRRRGYTVLNLIEIRKPYPDEQLSRKIEVDGQKFDY